MNGLSSLGWMAGKAIRQPGAIFSIDPIISHRYLLYLASFVAYIASHLIFFFFLACWLTPSYLFSSFPFYDRSPRHTLSSGLWIFCVPLNWINSFFYLLVTFAALPTKSFGRAMSKIIHHPQFALSLFFSFDFVFFFFPPSLSFSFLFSFLFFFASLSLLFLPSSF